MNLKELYLTKNACYIAGAYLRPKGIMVHSTGANNPNLKRYVGPDDGLLGRNAAGNHWNQQRPGGRQICPHAFIGKLNDGTVAAYQTLPWEMRGWHGASGPKGSVNDTHIGFEICEDNLSSAAYLDAVWREAVELCAHLCKRFALDPTGDGVIIGHYEGHARGVASNHADPRHWFSRHGRDMDRFRAEVREAVGGASEGFAPPKPAADDGKAVWDYLLSKGLSTFAAAGIIGNLYAESALRPTNLQNTYEKILGMSDAAYTTAVDEGSYANFSNDGAGYGLAQWTFPARKTKLLRYARGQGGSIGDIGIQMGYLWTELQGYTGLMRALEAASSVREASDAFLTQFEKPADQGEAVRARRAAYGQQYMDRFAGGGGTAPAAFAPYAVRVTTASSNLRIRGGPGTNHAITGSLKNGVTCTIREELSGQGAALWGKIAGGGWIALDFVKRV